MRISPAVGVISPSSIWIVVVLPAPFGPSRPRISPCRMSNETPSTAVKSPKRLVRFRTWTIGSVISQTCKDGVREPTGLSLRAKRSNLVREPLVGSEIAPSQKLLLAMTIIKLFGIESEEVLFEFFVDMAGEALPVQDLAVVLGLAVMAPETIHRSMGLDHRGLDGCLLCLRNLVQPDVPARDHDFVTLVRLRVDHGGVTSRAPFALAPLLEGLHVLAVGHDQAGLLQRSGQVPLGDLRDA